MKNIEFKCRKLSLELFNQKEIILLYHDKETNVRAELKACVNKAIEHSKILSFLKSLYKNRMITDEELSEINYIFDINMQNI